VNIGPGSFLWSCEPFSPRSGSFAHATFPECLVRFVADDDCLRYVRDLGDGAGRFGCVLRAHVLATHYVHLLANPYASGGVSRMLQLREPESNPVRAIPLGAG